MGSVGQIADLSENGKKQVDNLSHGRGEPNWRLRRRRNMDDKRFYRELKRAVKKAGTKSRRQALKRQLRDQPEDAPHEELGYGRFSSAKYNGLTKDHTRSSP